MSFLPFLLTVVSTAAFSYLAGVAVAGELWSPFEQYLFIVASGGFGYHMGALAWPR